MMNMEFPRRQESVYSPKVDQLLTSSMNVFAEWTTDPRKEKIALAMRSGAGLLFSIAAIAWPEAGSIGDVAGGAGIMNVILDVAGSLDDIKAESPDAEK